MYSGNSNSTSKAKLLQKTSPSFGNLKSKPASASFANSQGSNQKKYEKLKFLKEKDLETTIEKTFSSLKKAVDNIKIQDYKDNLNYSMHSAAQKNIYQGFSIDFLFFSIDFYLFFLFFGIFF